MAVILKCPHCEIKFRCEFGNESSWPDYCPNKKCGIYMGVDVDDDEIVMPSIRHASTVANDRVYREIESGSNLRAQMAAEQLGVPVSEMSDIKITNLNDRRDAEIAAVPVRNEVTRMMEAAPAGVTGFAGGNGVGYSGAVQAGPFPNAGAHMRSMIQQNHPQMVQRHAVGKDETGRAVIPSADVVSERPGVETTQPGYRRRA